VRIFSPLRELAFAGHPSIGACHILSEKGLVEPRNGIVTQECPAGLFDLNLAGDGKERSIAFRVPVAAVSPLSPSRTTSVGRALGACADRAFVVEAGARWIVVPFDDPAILDTMIPDQAGVRALSEATGTFGVTVYGPSPDADADIEVRSFGPLIGVDEDAVCGSGNACVGAARAQNDRSGGTLAFTVSQGRHRGRHGRVRVSASASDGFVSVGGAAVTSASGRLNREGAGSAFGHGARRAEQ
jgi:PhzF family phenazine biosynthesis protein